MKNSTDQIKNILESLNNRIGETEERMSNQKKNFWKYYSQTERRKKKLEN